MEYKWYMIMVAVVVAAMMAGATMSEYTKHQCQMSFASSTRTADEIAQICR